MSNEIKDVFVERIQKAIDNISMGVEILELIESQKAILSDGELTRLQSDKLAVEALKELLSRRCGCEYCAGDCYERKPLAKWDTYFDNWVREEHETRIDDYEGEYFVSSSPGEGPGFEIHFCPICGRHLAE